jgi:methionyl-tRNA formyltransferase
MKINIGLLISGNLGEKALKHLHSLENIIFVFTNKDSQSIVEFCRHNNIPHYIGNPRKSEKLTEQFLYNKHVDYIFSINYLFLVQKIILKHPKYYSVNIHGSLLPKYRGRTPHVWAIINGEKKTGVTVHLMDEECDNGDIILQKKINISQNSTGADILIKFNFEYIIMLDLLLQVIKNENLKFKKQDISKATYFGQRTPDDGLINWEWQKERIRNWVRAQAYPYPGAFSFYNKNKIIIDEIKFSDFGYSFFIPNGTIVKYNKYLYVKTSNGVVKLTKTRNTENINFEINKKLE